MFTAKAKRKYRTWIFSAVIVCLCIFIAALAWPKDPVEAEAGTAGLKQGETDFSSGTGMEQTPQEAIDDYLAEDPVTQNLPEDEENTVSSGNFDGEYQEKEENNMNQSSQSYYLVKRAGEQIAVFFCDANGNMVQLETTGILYELLGTEDQKLFDEGIRVNSQEELSVLLQDFEG